MGNKVSSLEFRLSIASTVAISAFAWGAWKHLSVLQLEDEKQKQKQKPTTIDLNGCILTYFNIAGKGECIRLALNHGNCTFTDRRVNKESFLSTYRAKSTFGQLPCLTLNEGTEDEINISQSAAILRLVGKSCNLYPTDPVVAAFVDSIMDFESDAFQGHRTIRYNYRFGLDVDIEGGDIETYFNNCKTKQREVVIPENLFKLENVLRNSSTGWLADTTNPTIADFFWVPTLQSLTRKENPWTGDCECLNAFPHIQQLVRKFEALSSVQNYYARKN